MQQPGHARPRRQAPGARQGSSVVPGPAALVSVLSSDPQWPRTPREAPGRTARPARSVPTQAACPPAYFWLGRKTCFCGRPWAVVGGTETCLFREALPARVSLPCPFARGTSSFSVARGSPLPRPWFLGFPGSVLSAFKDSSFTPGVPPLARWPHPEVGPCGLWSHLGGGRVPEQIPLGNKVLLGAL